VTNGTVAVPGVTRAGAAWMLRDAQARLYCAPVAPRVRPTARPARPRVRPYRASGSTARPPHRASGSTARQAQPRVRLNRASGSTARRTTAPVSCCDLVTLIE
jgi:hypothetical protein